MRLWLTPVHGETACPAAGAMARSHTWGKHAGQGIGMNIAHTLQTIARIHPDRPAIAWEGGTLSYRAFEDQVQRIAHALRHRHGLTRGDRVGIAMENAPEFYPLLYGIWRAGLSAVPMNSKLHPKEMAWILNDAEAKLCLASPKLGGELTVGRHRSDAADHRHRHRGSSRAVRRRNRRQRARRP